jgi:enterochelin esterase-like enzyme
MKLPLLVAVTLALLLPPVAQAQTPRGTVRERLTIDSKVLGRPVRYTVYLPYDYETSSRRYPVVYLLHGYTDDDTGWLQFGEAHLLADEAIASRAIPPMILVMPDAGTSWYVDNHDGSVRYETFFMEEFIPFIESRYRIRAEKRYRGLAGLSMGGFGSLVYGLRHPDKFAALAAFSAAVRTDEEMVAQSEEWWERAESVVYGPGLRGEERLTDHYRSYNPIHIVRAADPERFRDLRIYLDCGDDDFLYRGNATLHIALREREIPHEYRVRDGGHRWSYWRSGLIDGLAFIGTSFHQP